MMNRRLCTVLFTFLVSCDLGTSPDDLRSRVRDVAVGDGYTCAVTEGGRTYCWGENLFLQLALRETDAVRTPRIIPTSIALHRIYAGLPFCGVDREFRLNCWRAELSKPFGPDPDVVSDKLERIVDGSDFGVDAEGRLWGLTSGTLDAREPLGSRRVVARVMSAYFEGTRPDGEPASHYHGCALTIDGEAFCEGTNRYGELGLGPDEPADDSNRPYQPVLTDVRFSSLYAAAAHTCGISIAQELYCWGEGYGPLPRELMSGTFFSSMDASPARNCAVTSSGEGLCWNADSQDVFTEVAPGVRFQKISVSSADPHAPSNPDFPRGGHACGISLRGELYCWGSNDRGQLGTGNMADEVVPVRVRIGE